jgi:hypothetical protein
MLVNETREALEDGVSGAAKIIQNANASNFHFSHRAKNDFGRTVSGDKKSAHLRNEQQKHWPDDAGNNIVQRLRNGVYWA